MSFAASDVSENGHVYFPLKRFLQETEHFCRWYQQKVAKIVHYGLPAPFNNLHTLLQVDAVLLDERRDPQTEPKLKVL